jgi:hypothetical protein
VRGEVVRRDGSRLLVDLLLNDRPDAQMTIDHEANDPQSEVGNADHHVDGVVVGACEPDLVFFLRTGGVGDGLRSGRTGARGARRCEQQEEKAEQDKDAEPTHGHVSNVM